MKHKALCARHHYLMSRNPDDMKYLIEAGIKEDFTMCYADGGGYRLGTCRAVHWINPQSMEVTDLVLHPMLATEGKLYPKEYMGMSTEEIISFLIGSLNVYVKKMENLLYYFIIHHLMICQFIRIRNYISLL